MRLPGNQWWLFCTVLNLKKVGSREAGCDKALGSELGNGEGLGDGDGSNKGWSK
jgi:hypothetical protein